MGMRRGLFFLLLASTVCAAQDLPDPGRRLSPEEQSADPDKPRPTTKDTSATAPLPSKRNSAACERSRTYYQLACRAPNSYHSRSMECAEAYALYRQSCEP